MPSPSALPVDEILDAIVASLERHPNLVIVAPPGAGKTTRVPAVLVDRGVTGPRERVLVLEPRRLAARLAAEHIARQRRTRLGGEVGYRVRFDDKTSATTRIAFLTEGILTRMLASDPTLEDVGAVVLDEFHERSVHADLAIALLREIQMTIRPELHIVVMSATLDPKPIATFLGECPIVESRGYPHGVRVEWLPERDEREAEDLVVSGVKKALRDPDDDGGHILAFLPGAAEIRRAREALSAMGDRAIDVLPLYGELSSAEQDRVVAPSSRRKIILATNIAESSLTIDGVTTVVDSGFAKVPRWDPSIGIDRLELVRIGKESAKQRSGRAGRTGPGRAFRMWTEKEEHMFPPRETPEIRRTDLAGPLLSVLAWHPNDPNAFPWFEAPPPAMIERGVETLRALAALEPNSFRLTSLGQRLAALPIHPRLGAIVVRGCERGFVDEAALLAATASERDVLRKDANRRTRAVGASDLLVRYECLAGFEREGGDASAALRWELDLGAARNALRVRDRLRELGGLSQRKRSPSEDDLLRLLLVGFADRVGRRVERGTDRVLLAHGGSARLSSGSVVKDAEYLLAIDIDAGDAKTKREGIVRMASEIRREWLEDETVGFAERSSIRFNGTREVVERVRQRCFFELILDERIERAPVGEESARVLADAARRDLERAIPMTEELEQHCARFAFVRRAMPEIALPALELDLRMSLIDALVEGCTSFSELRAKDVRRAIDGTLSREAHQAIERGAPREIEIPSGRRAALRWEREGPPVLSVRLQELFGLRATPRIAGGRVPIKVELLGPNMRPVQVTQDLENFWATTYAEVRKELRRRYPKHQWPEDPNDGIPSKKVRPR